jgi:hypothetical protein
LPCALAPEVRPLGVTELAVLGERVDDRVDVAAGESVGDLAQAFQCHIEIG